MFKRHEDIKQLFKKFRNLKTEDELRTSEALEKHGGTVMGVIDETITNIENVDCILGVLHNAGLIHGRVEGFCANMLWVCMNCFTLLHLLSFVGDSNSYVGDNNPYTGLINTYVEDNNFSVGLNNTYVRDNNSYVGLTNTYLGITNTYVGDNKSYVGVTNPYAGDNKSYVGLTSTYI